MRNEKYFLEKNEKKIHEIKRRNTGERIYDTYEKLDREKIIGWNIYNIYMKINEKETKKIPKKDACGRRWTKEWEREKEEKHECKTEKQKKTRKYVKMNI